MVEPTAAVTENDDAVEVVDIVGSAQEQPWHRYVRRREEARARGELDELEAPEQIEISVAAPRSATLPGIGRLENNLARKAIFDLKTTHGDEGSIGNESRTDLVGKTTLSFTMGALGPLEMDLIAFTMGQWHRRTPEVSFTLREIARSLNVSWKGQLGAAIKASFLRIKALTITGRVWDAGEKKHTTLSFNIFDRVEIVEERATEHGPATSPASIKIVLSEWVLNQLRAGQYSDFEWDGYRGKLTTPFARRLYLLLESQEGMDDGTVWRVKIDHVLGQTLGTADGTKNPSRFRANLRASGAEICRAWPSVYRSISVVAGSKRGEYFLEVKRSLQWREQRLARRRKALAEPAA